VDIEIRKLREDEVDEMLRADALFSSAVAPWCPWIF
jgi:hypothetical protein